MKSTAAIFTLCISIISCNAQTRQTSLSVSEFEKSITKGDVQVLDVRTAAEYNSGHLNKSVQADWYNQKQFKERVNALDKSKPVYVYCLSGVRSKSAVKWMKENGFADAQDLKGGLMAWKKAGKSVENAVSVKQITAGEYKELTGSAKTVLVDFGAVWCPPCKKMEPVITKLKNDASDKYKIVNIDAGTQTEIMKQMKVEALPVFIVYKNGKEVWRKEGIATLEELKSKLL